MPAASIGSRPLAAPGDTGTDPCGFIVANHLHENADIRLVGDDGELGSMLFGEGGGGAVLPIGYKGYGLAVIGEILSGALSGARILDEIPLFFTNLEKPVGNGHFHIAIDISKFVDIGAFKVIIRLVEVPKRLAVARPMSDKDCRTVGT